MLQVERLLLFLCLVGLSACVTDLMKLPFLRNAEFEDRLPLAFRGVGSKLVLDVGRVRIVEPNATWLGSNNMVLRAGSVTLRGAGGESFRWGLGQISAGCGRDSGTTVKCELVIEPTPHDVAGIFG